MVVCRQCGKELTNPYSTDICLDCSRENVKKIFNEYPEVKQAFKESIDELKKPENMKTVTDALKIRASLLKKPYLPGNILCCIRLNGLAKLHMKLAWNNCLPVWPSAVLFQQHRIL